MFGAHQVRKGWQDRLFAAFCRSPAAKTRCVLAVGHRHFKKITSKSVRSPFFTCVAQCRFLSAIVTCSPLTTSPVDVTVVHCEE